MQQHSIAMSLAEAHRLAQKALEQSDSDIARILAPRRGVAFVGSTAMGTAMRHQIARYGDVNICLVNPKGGEGEVPIYRSIRDLPDGYDLAVIRVAAPHIAGIIEDCGHRGIRDVLIYSDGFAEAGPEGAALEAELARTIARAGVRVVGPNTNDNSFERFARPAAHKGGGIALITQSGANGRSLVEGVAMGACFHRWITVGNEVDLETADFIHHFAGLDEVAAIALYVEGFKSAAKLRIALERALRANKPVIAIKMGSTERGARSAASHTGHLTGADAVVDGLFRQYGVTRVSELDELLETANLFSKLPAGMRTRPALYTVSGGTAALMAEAADAAGLDVPEFPAALQDDLHRHIPTTISVANPVDNGGGFPIFASAEDRQEVLRLIASAEQADLLVVGLNAAFGLLSDGMANDLRIWTESASKRAVAIWPSVVTDTPGYANLVGSGVPIFRSFGKCMRALKAFETYGVARARFETPALSADLTPAQTAALATPGVIDAPSADVLLRAAGVPFPSNALVRTPQEAAAAASRIGFPVVMKLLSPDIPHKTEYGLVRLGVIDVETAGEVARNFLDKAAALVAPDRIDGIQIQEQISGGIEMIVGLSQDAQFGPTITIGAGGIHAEAIPDVACCPLPITAADARAMIARLRMAPLLAGVRGAAPADVAGLVELILAVAELGLAAGPALAELDLNPVLVRPDRVVVLDALAVAAPRPSLQPEEHAA